MQPRQEDPQYVFCFRSQGSDQTEENRNPVRIQTAITGRTGQGSDPSEGCRIRSHEGDRTSGTDTADHAVSGISQESHQTV